MIPRRTIILLVLIAATSTLFGQDAKYQKLFQFDIEKFKERLKENNSFELDALPEIQGVIASNFNKNYSMRWFEVKEEDMAQMPNMSIRKDVHYTMKIKKYELQYPYAKPDRIKKLLENKDLKVPMKKH